MLGGINLGCTLLLYLQNDVVIWASSAKEEFSQEAIPFTSSYNTFCEQFKARFETVDKAIDAKAKLYNLK